MPIKFFLTFHYSLNKAAKHFSWNINFLVLITLPSFYISFYIFTRYQVFFNCLMTSDPYELSLKTDSVFVAKQFNLSLYLNANWNRY